GHMYLANAYPNSAVSAGAMMAIAFVMVGVLAFWLVMVYLAARDKSGGKHGGQVETPAGAVAQPEEAAEDERSEARRAPAGSRHATAA
ncbi:MAG TPA: hypothetical protein VHF26_10120, partial [Trebonia sp.]|nr:hypothetical protein [Trebonia sp.]